MSVTEEDVVQLIKDSVADGEIAAGDERLNQEAGEVVASLPAVGDEPEMDDTEQAVEMSPEDLESIVAQMIDNAAYGTTSGVGRGDNSLYNLIMQYYLGRKRGDEVDGRSEMISMDVADMTEAVMAQIMPQFLQDTMVTFGATGEGDEDQARQEGEVVNDVIKSMNDGYVNMFSAVKDALLFRNCVAEVYVEEKDEVASKRFGEVDDETFAQLVQPTTQEEQVFLTHHEETIGGSEDEMGNVSPFARKHTGVVKRVKSSRRPITEVFSPEDFLYDRNHRSVRLDDCRFSARRMFPTRSELIAQGYDREVVDALEATPEGERDESVRRSESYSSPSVQHTLDVVTIFRCYVRIDFDGDGIAELLRVIMGGEDGSTLIHYEPVSSVGIVSGTPIIMAHQVEGLGLFDKLWDVQDGKTSTLRQYDDNHNHMNNRRITVNMEMIEDPASVTDSFPGGVIKANGDARAAVAPFPVDDIGPSSIMRLQYYDSIATHRAGASLDMQSKGANMPSNIGNSGADRIMSSHEQMAQFIATNLAQTFVRDLYMQTHRMLREEYRQPIDIQKGEKWVNSDPTQWQRRDRINVFVGATIGERARKAASLREVIGFQVSAIEKGNEGILTDLSKLHNALTDLCDSVGLPYPNRYWIDPDSDPSIERQKQVFEEKDRQKKLAEGMTQAQAEMATKVANAEIGKAQAQIARVEMQGQVERFKHQLQSLKSFAESEDIAMDRKMEMLKFVDDHMKWLTTLEVDSGLEINKMAAGNRPGKLQ